jgi:hypothetical protein
MQSIAVAVKFGFRRFAFYLVLLLGVAICGVALAQEGEGKADDTSDLAKKLANPISSLISMPFQYNHDSDLGPTDNGSKNYLNIQPVVPFALGADWNLISRTIVPLVELKSFPVVGSSQSGLGDVTASQFFSPTHPTKGGWTWGAGPVELLPTASEKNLGTGKWGLGPTFVALKQEGPVTYGFLANHIWSVAGESNRASVNSTFLQPFFAYVTKTKTTFSINLESSYDWQAGAWSVPVNVSAAQLLKIGPQILQIALGARYWATSPANGPEGWGWRAVVTLLFPK